jgi:hypothetical protein
MQNRVGQTNSECMRLIGQSIFLNLILPPLLLRGLSHLMLQYPVMSSEQEVPSESLIGEGTRVPVLVVQPHRVERNSLLRFGWGLSTEVIVRNGGITFSNNKPRRSHLLALHRPLLLHAVFHCEEDVDLQDDRIVLELLKEDRAVRELGREEAAKRVTASDT